jgi:DNA-binding CsgD family transcriptional regulator
MPLGRGKVMLPPEKSTQAQMKYLVKQLKTTKQVAQLLGI